MIKPHRRADSSQPQRGRKLCYEGLEDRRMLAVDLAAVSTAFNDLETDVLTTIDTAKVAADTLRSTIASIPQSGSALDIIDSSVIEPIADFRGEVVAAFDAVEQFINSGTTIAGVLNGLDEETGGIIEVNGGVDLTLPAAPNSVTFNLDVTLLNKNLAIALPSSLNLLGIDFSLGSIGPLMLEVSSVFSATVQLSKPASDLEVLLVPREVDGENIAASLDFTAVIDFGAPTNISTDPFNGLTQIPSGTIAGLIDYSGAFDIVFSPELNVRILAPNAAPVKLQDLNEPTAEFRADSLQVNVPVDFQLEADSLPDFRYRSLIAIDPNATDTNESTTTTDDDQIRETRREVFLGGVLIADEDGLKDEGVLINELLKQSGFDLIEKVADYIPPDVAQVLLGNTEIFGDITLDVITGSNVYPDRGFIETEDTSRGTAGSPLNYLKVFGIPAEGVDLLEIILQVSQDRGEFEKLIGGTSDNADAFMKLGGSQGERSSGLGYEFPVKDDPLGSVLQVLQGQQVDLVRFNVDFVDLVFSSPPEINSGPITIVAGDPTLGTFKRVEVKLSEEQIEDFLVDAVKDVVGNQLPFSGIIDAAVKGVIEKAFDILGNPEFTLLLQGGVQAGVDTYFLTPAGNYSGIDSNDPLNSLFIDRRSSLLDFEISFSLEQEKFVTTGDILDAILAIPGVSEAVEALANADEAVRKFFAEDLASALPPGTLEALAEIELEADCEDGDCTASVNGPGGSSASINVGKSGISGEIDTPVGSVGGGISFSLVNFDSSGRTGFGFDIDLSAEIHAKIKGGPSRLRGRELVDAFSSDPLSLFVLDARGQLSVDVEAALLGVTATASFDFEFGDFGNPSATINGTSQANAINLFAEIDPATGVLLVYGSADSDVLDISYDSINDEVVLRLSGAPQRFDASDVDSIHVDLRGLKTPQNFDGNIAANRSENGTDDDFVQIRASLNDLSIPIEVIGGSGNDTISALDLSNPIQPVFYEGSFLVEGGGGMDTITGGAGLTRIEGGDERDVLTAGPGLSFIDGGLGNDKIAGIPPESKTTSTPAFFSTFIGGPGNDILAVGSNSRGSFLLIGGSFDAGGNPGNNIITGGASNDVLVGGNYSSVNGPDLNSDSDWNLLSGGAGDDSIFGTNGEDTIFGGGILAFTSSGVDQIVAGAGNDIITSGNTYPVNTLAGIVASDFITPSQSGRLEEIDAGSGNDTILVGSGSPDISIFGQGDNDEILIGNGSINEIRGQITVDTGPGGNDKILVNDFDFYNGETNDEVVDYQLTPTSFKSSIGESAPAGQAARNFGGLNYNGSVEFFHIDGTDAPSIFEVSPSRNTEYLIDGNLPATRTVPSRLGDFLKLNTDGTTGRNIKFESPKSGNGRWIFDSPHKDVIFKSMERFNHVERLAVTAEAARDGKPTVRVYDAETKEFLFEFTPYEGDYRDGVRVATGDVDEDGIPDIVVAPGRLHEPLVKVYDGLGPDALATMVLAVTEAQILDGDFDGDGRVSGNDFLAWQRGVSSPTILTANSNETKVMNEADLSMWASNFGTIAAPPLIETQSIIPQNITSDDYKLTEFLAYDPSFINGLTLAVGDVTGDFSNDIVVAPSRGPSEVRVFENVGFSDHFELFDSFLAYDPSFIGGATVAIGDLTGDQRGDIVTSTGSGSYVTVRVFDGSDLQTGQSGTPIEDFVAFDSDSRGGSFVAIGNVIGDLTPDIVLGSGPYSGSRVQIFDGANLPSMGTQFATPDFEYNPNVTAAENNRAPLRVVIKDHDLDGVADTVFTAQGPDGESHWLREFSPVDLSVVDALFEDDDEFLNGFWLG